MQEENSNKLIDSVGLERDEIDAIINEVVEITGSGGSRSVRVTERAYELMSEICNERNISINAYATNAIAIKIIRDKRKKIS